MAEADFEREYWNRHAERKVIEIPLEERPIFQGRPIARIISRSYSQPRVLKKIFQRVSEARSDPSNKASRVILALPLLEWSPDVYREIGWWLMKCLPSPAGAGRRKGTGRVQNSPELKAVVAAVKRGEEALPMARELVGADEGGWRADYLARLAAEKVSERQKRAENR